VDRVGPILNDLSVLAKVFVGRNEGSVVGEADGLADRHKEMRLFQGAQAAADTQSRANILLSTDRISEGNDNVGDIDREWICGQR